jgi:hypothetical protein
MVRDEKEELVCQLTKVSTEFKVPSSIKNKEQLFYSAILERVYQKDAQE